MARIGTRSLLLAIDGIDRTDEVARAVLSSVQSTSQRRLCAPDYEHGGMRAYRLTMTAAQDTGASSLWRMAWERPSQAVPFYLAPYGNWAATTDQPHHSGTAIIVGPDGDLLGGDAAASRTSVLTVSMTWVVLGTPELVTEGAYPADLPEGW